MGAFFSDYWPAITAIITFLSGLAGLLLQDRPNSKRISFGIFVLFGIISMFGTFNSIHESKVAADAEKDKRIAMKDLLGAAINDCAALNVKKRTESQEDVDAYANDAGVLATKTRNLIAQAYGEGEANLFMNDAGISTMASPGHPNVLMRSEMIARIQRLNELITRVDTITMRPDFDPRNYHPA
jgi:hypothetical protein